MYSEEMISIGKIENGYLIQVRVPYKSDSDECGCCVHPSSQEKQFHVADVDELNTKLKELLPALEDKMDAEAVFKNTFKEAAKDE